ncbi:mRNA cleavage and polyadenylation specificity factor complex associated protein (PNUTS) [Schizosaccharomyces pombe]|uniref:Cleavage and polyadenylation factor complex subunit C74.02c n=1 Tax=Schizosaccharomyces pombe (strain 972 / ATCC 24843) TaxID=284812 RepID=CPSFX_SCHPO|nr:cleavage and polyadenylation specificity factor complex-associated protein [Schizosaccharomyces pombe]O74535.1 RecName: Full=Cleavage and polyadenylation factor complex subunit C74.02c [Schizosaccharomyces pombe 972h-]CAA20832.1 mRNA cleavage and polyadenylation specificity factor complex associated protein [Schizosaccharomyces pombe]|eukprot:NP_588375.1 cleavage and polyadenylation specificity factor complex-associated protein [Schizosaccharomyces pombe]
MDNWNSVRNVSSDRQTSKTSENPPHTSNEYSGKPEFINLSPDLEENLDEKLMSAFPGLEPHVFQHSQSPLSHKDASLLATMPSVASSNPSLISSGSSQTGSPSQSLSSNKEPSSPGISPSNDSQSQNTNHTSISANPYVNNPSHTSRNPDSGSSLNTASHEVPSSKSDVNVQMLARLKSKSRQKISSSDPLEDLRLTLTECLNPINIVQAPKECAAILVNLMSNITQDDQKLVFLDLLKSKVGNSIYSQLVDGGRKLFLPKLRNWFVSAIRSKHDELIHLILLVLANLPLTTEKLAEVKFGKPILIVKKKSTNSVIRQLAENLSELAEKSFTIEQNRENEKSSTKNDSTVSSSAVVMAPAGPAMAPSASNKPSASSTTKSSNSKSKKKVTSISGTSFFKNLASSTKPTSASSSTKAPLTKQQTNPSTPLSSIMAGLKGREKEKDKDSGISSENVSNNREELPSFRKRSSSSRQSEEIASLQAENAVFSSDPASNDEKTGNKKRKKKSVSWKPDNDLVQVKFIESLNEEGAASVKTPHIYGNARDMDRQEARVAFGSHVEDDVENEIIWYKPVPIKFEISKDEIHPRGYKCGGNERNLTPEATSEIEREKNESKDISTFNIILDLPVIREFDDSRPPAHIKLVSSDTQATTELGFNGLVQQVSENNTNAYSATSNSQLSSIFSNLSSSISDASSNVLQNPSLSIPNYSNAI